MCVGLGILSSMFIFIYCFIVRYILHEKSYIYIFIEVYKFRMILEFESLADLSLIPQIP